MTEVSMSSKRYTEEFKVEAVKQVVDRGHSVVEVAERLDVNKHSLYAWIKRSSKPVRDAGASGDCNDAMELRRLRAELKRVTEERDILKKAAAYFAKQSG
jgi:transposase